MEPSRKTYPQKWHEYNLAQTNEKAHFQTFLYELCQQVGKMPRKPGAGRNRLPLCDMLFAAVFKVYNTVSARRFMSDLREAFQRGLISKVPHFNSIFNYLELEELTDVLKRLIIESSLPLKAIESDFAVDSSGFSTGIYQKWVQAKWGTKGHSITKNLTTINKQDWVKVHLMCGVTTNVVTSVEISHAHAGDSPYFKPLVETTAQNFKLREVSADKAYSSEANMHLVLIHGGEPYIAFRKNATAGNRRSGSVWKRLFLEYQYNQEYFMRHYHKRSNVETTFSMIKAKFGERLRSKSHTAQINEVLCKVLCHNLCCVIQSMYELGLDVNFCAADDPAQNLDS
jgi:transposase